MSNGAIAGIVRPGAGIEGAIQRTIGVQPGEVLADLAFHAKVTADGGDS